MKTSPSAQFYYRENGLGSNVATLDSSGATVSKTEYDAYGIEEDFAPGTNSSFRFAGAHGYVTDDDSGMDMLGARYYMPALGRFFTQDPLGQEAGLNLYQYCGNNPLGSVDPTGTRDLTSQDIGRLQACLSRRCPPIMGQFGCKES